MTNELDGVVAGVLAQYEGPGHESLRGLIIQLVARVAELEAELKRHSGNSSKPPSADTLAQRQAQKARRQAWMKKGAKKRRPGKQPGAPGAHLAQVEHPDAVVLHGPEVCEECGSPLTGAEVVGSETRQVFDLPEPKVIVTEHVAQRRRCSCGYLSAGAFPPEASAPAAFGPVLRGVAAYFLVHQHLPVARTAQCLFEVLGIPVSTGWVASLLPEAEALLEEFSKDLRGELIASPVIGNDETGARIAGERYWFHDATTELLTLITCHRRRGRVGMEAAGVLPEFKGISVHDRYGQYWTFDCTHSVCGAHLLRDLAAVAETRSQEPWAEAMANLLLSAKQKADAARERGKDSLSPQQRRRIAKAYDEIVTQAIRANPDPLLLGRERRTKAERESFNLALAFDSLKAEILRFCENLAVAFTNNGSERGFRMVKIRQKVSGCYRTHEGAQAFCAAWSYVSTARKHGQSPLGVLISMFRRTPWAIPHPLPG